ncbi:MULTISPECIES: LysE family translocator [Pseudoalteromonas]|uniref:LysE family translocator n=1 Tax=Pseudoalteromonas TaxID=53246 RepID=UPI0007321287|nr:MULTISPECIES: LysE family transporter [Pseudoalteromonas]KTF11153.1 lysine transporter LysE [Pseudoalteromonas sp. H103]MDO6464901.1 LysE family transporter [Pseudoalteromonas carrageenovora]MDO6636363.1 LysE family transporter [Pseudoalteromonas carrageenovora]MDO6648778.1 LysE family transporter [Pseudoalteromonas carrageenovora]
MNYLDEFLLIAIAHFFAVASPGPDFAVVLKQSVQQGRRNALWTSAGVGVAILLHVGYCVLGVALILTQSPNLFIALKYLAGAYLAYLGVQALRAAKPPENTSDAIENKTVLEESVWLAFRRGFLTNALNPKATLFFMSLFTLVISVTTPTSVQIAYGVYMALATWVWFSMLSLVLSKPGVRGFFQKSGYWFDRGIGVILIALAIRVVI